MQCGDAELEKKVDEKIDQIIDRVEKHPNKKTQVHITIFIEEKLTKLVTYIQIL